MTTTTTTLEQNPLLAGLPLRRRPEPCTIVIFGASGDLTERKLMPALYSLAFRRLLPEHFAVVGVARSEESDDGFREGMRTAIERFARDPFRQEIWDELAAGMRYLQLNAMDDESGRRLADLLRSVDEERGTNGNRLYYFAVPPAAFEPLVGMVAGMPSEGGGWNRLIVEKPFGHDLASARELNELVTQHFTEQEIFRIDHYLGKETVQNMLALRFANGIFEPIWNRQFIDHIQITVAESMGIEGRAAFYEKAGAIRDIFQNHLLQLLAITAMEPPSDFTADSVRNEKVKVLRSLHTPGPKSVVRGQYGRGFVEGAEVPGYREEEGVAPDSQTETFVAAKLYVDNWRWADTPFYVRMGKRLPRRETTIAIQFKRAPHPPFEEVSVEGLRPNVLLIHVQPDEGLSLAIGAKMPGQGMTIRTVHMDFLYGSQFREGLPEAYERLILDAMLGDATLFTRADEIEEQWALVDAIVAGWARDRAAFPNYAAGTWGPPSSDELVHRDGRSWRRH
jgi:glucose-6-phosphate 1-dehydrogenase